MNEEIIRRLELLIKRLEQTKGISEGTARSINSITRSIEGLNAALNKVSTGQIRNLQTLLNQISKIETSLDVRLAGRFRLGEGTRVFTNPILETENRLPLLPAPKNIPLLPPPSYAPTGLGGYQSEIYSGRSIPMGGVIPPSQPKIYGYTPPKVTNPPLLLPAPRQEGFKTTMPAEDDPFFKDMGEKERLKILYEANKKQKEFLREAIRDRLDLRKKEVEEERKINAAKKANAQAVIDQEKEINARAKAQRKAIFDETKLRNQEEQEQRRKLGIPFQDVSNIPGIQGAQRKAEKYDPDAVLTGARTDVSSGITRLTYTAKTADGVLRQLHITLDKFGKPLVDTQRRFRTFGDNVMRDIQEVAKWSIAVAVVYGPIQKFSELMQLMIKNEAALADVQISLANSQKTVNEVFEASFRIAQDTGEGLDGVIEAYNQAYRAVGAIQDATTRFTTANKLLYDSITLSKLSTLSQAEAIDILTAALKQSGLSLDSGVILLDKWVRTTKIANVDLATLATGFSVVGDAADAAGVTIDKLNAVIATVAETSGSAPKEVANMVRALIAGFQSDKARTELGKLGIAIQDVEGNARSFIDIMDQLYKLRVEGVINDTQFSKLTLALGGGTRRQALYATFIENYGKVADIEKQSFGASGDAADALSKKLDTVQTSITKVANAFQGLAQALGNEGGLLDIFKFLLNVGTFLITTFDKLTATLGKAGPLLYIALGATAYLSKQTDLYKKNVTNAVGFGLGRASQFVGANYNQALSLATGTGEYLRTGAIAGRPGATMGARAISGAGAGILPAIQALSEKDYLKAGADIAGGIIGSLATKGSFVGSIIGVAIVEAIVNGIRNAKIDLNEVTIEKPTAEVESITGTVQTDLEKRMTQAIGGTFSLALSKGVTGFLGIFDQKYASRTDADVAIERLREMQARAERPGYLGAPYRENKDEIASLLKELENFLNRQAGVTPEATAINLEFAKPIADEIKKMQTQLRTEFTQGLLGASPFKKGISQVSGLNVSAPLWQSAFGGAMGSFQQNLPLFSKLQGYGDAENLDLINTYTQDILTLNESLEQIKGTAGLTELYGQTLEALNNKIKEVTAFTKLMAEAIDKEVEARKKAKEETIDFTELNMTLEEFDKLIGITSKSPQYLAVEQALTPLGYKPEEIDKIIATENKEGAKEFAKVQGKDWKIVQYLLGQIEKNTRDITGVYNLPEGAEFFVPWRGAELDFQTRQQQAMMGATLPTAQPQASPNLQYSLDEIKKSYTSTLTSGVKTMSVAEAIKMYGKIGEPALTKEIVKEVPEALTIGKKAEWPGELKPVKEGNFWEQTKTLFEGIILGMGTSFQKLFQLISGEKPSEIGQTPEVPRTSYQYRAMPDRAEAMTAKLSLTLNNHVTVEINRAVLGRVVNQYLAENFIKFAGSTNLGKSFAI